MDGRTRAAVWLRPDAPVEIIALPVRKGGLFVVRMARWLAAQRFDLVLTYNWGAIETVLAARLARARVIHAEDGFREDEVRAQKARRVIARRILLRGLPAVVVPSRTLQVVAEQLWRLSPQSVLHIDNGIDTERFSPGSGAEVRRELGIAPDACVAGTVSTLRPVKNVAKLLRAFDHAAPATAHLVVVGDGPDRAALEALARQLPARARIHFAGPRPDPVAWYRAMDVFALSSLSEQMPISVVEAMGSGRAILSTDVGDVAAMVAPENRPYVVQPAGDEAFAAALRALAADRELRARLGAANRERCVARFDESTMVAEYERLYRRVLG
jgi:glycosyltransferase involved in cell wall biosynthesis